MSKFVTYPAVTVLDDDQSLLIDSPSAGTNSITAENAGNTLLSKWAGFETFDEAVRNTIENNQEFIDRDTAIREETAELKKKIVTTFPAKDASGAVATFESEFEDAPLKSCIVQVNPVQDLHGYDSPWPAGGGDCVLRQYEETPVIPGLTISVSGGKITVSGTVESTTTIDAPVTNWQWDGVSDYWLSGCPAGGNNINGYSLRVDGTNGRYSDYDIGNGIRLMPYSSDISGTDLKFRIVLRAGTYSNLTFAPMLNAGLSAKPYSPYENICPISGWTGCEVQRTGKNLLNLVESEMIMNGWNRLFPISLKAGTYIISCQHQFGVGTTLGCQILFTDEDNVLVKYLWQPYTFGDSVFVGHPVALTAEEAKKIKFIRFALRAGNGTYNDIVQGNIQLELGSTATAYHPYTGQTYPITFPSEAGTIHGGYIDPINGELAATHAEVDMGTLSWTYYASGNYFYAIIPDRIKYIEALPKVVSACDKYAYFGLGTSTELQNNMPNANYGFTTNSAKRYIYLKDNRYTNVNDLVASLSGTQLVYALTKDSITTYPITATENIKTLLGTNNIWSNTGDTSVEYLMSDVSWYVEKKLKAFQSILAGVEYSSSASKNYSANTYLIFNDDIYKTTTAITAGETIEEGVNVTKTTVAEQLMALAQA